jgi:hypothetical protein
MAGCKESEEIDPALRIFAEFTIDGKPHSFESKLSEFSGLGSFSAIQTDDLIFSLGTHLGYKTDYYNTVFDKVTERDKGEALIGVLMDMDKKFARTLTFLKDEDIGCFSCSIYFKDVGFSLTYMTNVEDLTKKEIWTTGYGDQGIDDFKFIVKNLRTAEYMTTQLIKNVTVISVLGDIEFSCLIFDKNGHSQRMIGKGTMPFYSFQPI